MKKPRNTRDYHKVQKLAEGGPVVSDDDREAGYGKLKDAMVANEQDRKTLWAGQAQESGKYQSYKTEERARGVKPPFIY